MFRLNVSAICVVLTLSILAGFTNGRPVIDPSYQVPRSLFIATVAFLFFPPILFDSILLTRLFALYPPATTPLATLLKIFAFPFCVKCTRVAVITTCLRDFISSGKTTEALIRDELTIWFRNPYLIAGWTVQIADNLYSVGLFLYNLHVRLRPIKNVGISISGRIRQVFYISAANFVFPLIFNIALLFFVTTDHSPNTGILLVFINNYITVMGVLCATLWFSRLEWVRTHDEPFSGEMPPHALNLGRVSAIDRKAASDIVLMGTRTVALNPEEDIEARADSTLHGKKRISIP